MTKVFQKIRFLIIPVMGLATLLPMSVFAAPSSNGTLLTFLTTLNSTLGRIIPILIGLALLVFLWGIIKYITSAGEQDKKSAIGYIINGIVALFFMVSIWGIVALLDSATSASGSSLILPTGKK